MTAGTRIGGSGRLASPRRAVAARPAVVACAALLAGLLATVRAAPAQAVVSFSGGPPLLEITIPDPEHTIASVRVETTGSLHRWRVAPDPEREELRLAASPFTAPGVHDLTLTVSRTDAAADHATALRVGFVDFVFGRDNLSFGNNADYRSSIGTFAEILEAWLEKRFGGVSEAELVMLADFMYGLFGRNTGRCYAFSGTIVRYLRWPDLRPNYYETTYSIRSTSTLNQRRMNYLQLDMAFDHFVSDGVLRFEIGPMGRDQILAQLESIRSRIALGEPVAVGFTGPDLHHSMVVFGFVENPAEGVFDLLVANNWKSGERQNIHSRDAEIVRVRTGDEGTPPSIDWLHETGPRDRVVDRLFVVDVRREEYAHDRADLDRFLAWRTDEFRRSARRVVIVEDAAGARVTDGELATGRLKSRAEEQLPDVRFEKIGRTYRFDLPPSAALTLEIADDRGARVLSIAPGGSPGEESAWVRETDRPTDGATVTRQVSLAE